MNLHLLVCTLRFLLPATVVQCTLRKEKTIGPKLWAHEIQLFNMQRSQGRLLKPTNRVPPPSFFSSYFRGFVRVCKCTSAAAIAPLLSHSRMPMVGNRTVFPPPPQPTFPILPLFSIFRWLQPLARPEPRFFGGRLWWQAAKDRKL